MRIALTANGPGEFAGWLRPLVAALYAADPELDARIFCVPDDYATGHEAAYARALFPRAVVYEPREELRFVLGRGLDGLTSADRVHYLGGDLEHAARIHERLGGIATAYKFSRRRYRDRFARVFAVDAANREQLLGWGIPDERIAIVGNLAIDGALREANGEFGDPPDDIAQDGIVVLPGSRPHELANLTPMFLRVAVQLRRRVGGAVPIVFGRSPFTDDDDLRAALERGGDHPRAYGMRGTLASDGASTAIVAETGDRFPLVGAAMRAAARARLAVTIPGTKVIELAALGIPAVVVTPMNAPEVATINGPLQYLGRLPLVGIPLKRAAAVAFARRFRFFAQPNIDAGRELDRELRGTALPARVASVVAASWADTSWCRSTGAELRDLYGPQAGAAERIAAALVDGGAPSAPAKSF